jgi:hypothetical protein
MPWDGWVHVYAHGRQLSPLLFLLALHSLERRSWMDLAPLATLLPRIGLEVLSQVCAILLGVTTL